MASLRSDRLPGDKDNLPRDIAHGEEDTYGEDIPLATWNHEGADDDEENLSDYERQEGFSEAFTVEEERRVVRKLDRRMVLFVALLYLLSFLDRSSTRPYHRVRVIRLVCGR